MIPAFANRVRSEFQELKKPTARCFKGFAILLFIWGTASLLICGLVPAIIIAHLDQNPTQHAQMYHSSSPSQDQIIDVNGDSNFNNTSSFMDDQNSIVNTTFSTDDQTVDSESIKNDVDQIISKPTFQPHSEVQKGQNANKVDEFKQIQENESNQSAQMRVLISNYQTLIQEDGQRYQLSVEIVGEDSDQEIRDKAKLVQWICLGVGLGLYVLSGINILFFLKYKKQEEINEQVAANEIVRDVHYDN
eukprot:403350818